MDLTDKINSYNIAIGRTGNPMNDAHFANGVDHALTEITPKVAIDFANWVVNSRYIAIRDSNEFTDYNANLYTTEQLFEEFLKEYKYEG